MHLSYAFLCHNSLKLTKLNPCDRVLRDQLTALLLVTWSVDSTLACHGIPSRNQNAYADITSTGHSTNSELANSELAHFSPWHISTPIISILYALICMAQDNWVGIATCFGMDGSGIEFRWKQDFPHLSRPALGPTQHPMQWVPCLFRR